MLGIEDKGVAWAYALCLISALVCVVYGIINWNRGGVEMEAEDFKWAEEEKKVEEEL